jgi:hypothetical protein
MSLEAIIWRLLKGDTPGVFRRFLGVSVEVQEYTTGTKLSFLCTSRINYFQNFD